MDHIKGISTTKGLVMNFLIIVLAFAVSLFAIDIEVVDCETVMKTDPPPLDKILSDTYNDIKQNPYKFVCAYHTCDFHHNGSWFAIKKNKSIVFRWDKRSNTTENLVGIYDADGFILTRVKFDKYGIMDVGWWLGKQAHDYQDLSIKALLTPASRCTEVYDTVGNNNEAKTMVLPDNCWGDPLGDHFCE